MLLQLMSICLSPKIPPVEVEKLEFLIEKHHKSFMLLYNTTLSPKQHFITHYPNVIKKMGPLIHLWCMRYESKRGVLKSLAQKLNFKNIGKTLATRVQELTILDRQQNSLNYEMEFTPVEPIMFSD